MITDVTFFLYIYIYILPAHPEHLRPLWQHCSDLIKINEVPESLQLQAEHSLAADLQTP